MYSACTNGCHPRQIRKTNSKGLCMLNSTLLGFSSLFTHCICVHGTLILLFPVNLQSGRKTKVGLQDLKNMVNLHHLHNIYLHRIWVRTCEKGYLMSIYVYFMSVLSNNARDKCIVHSRHYLGQFLHSAHCRTIRVV